MSLVIGIIQRNDSELKIFCVWVSFFKDNDIEMIGKVRNFMYKSNIQAILGFAQLMVFGKISFKFEKTFLLQILQGGLSGILGVTKHSPGSFHCHTCANDDDRQNLPSC